MDGKDKYVNLEVLDCDWLVTDESLGKTKLDTGMLKAGEWHDLEQSLGDGNGSLKCKIRVERQEKKYVEKADKKASDDFRAQSDQTGAAIEGAKQGAGRIVTVQILPGHALANTEARLTK